METAVAVREVVVEKIKTAVVAMETVAMELVVISHVTPDRSCNT